MPAREGKPAAAGRASGKDKERPLMGAYKRLLALSCRKELSRGDVAVLGVLLEHHNADTGRCDPGRARLSGLSGLSKTGVSNSLAKLERLKWIKINRHRGNSRTNVYVPNFGKLKRLASSFEAQWDSQADLIDRDADGQADLTDMVNSTCPGRSSQLDTNPLSNPLKNPLNENELQNEEEEDTTAHSERVGETVSARQENGGDFDAERTGRELAPADIARRRWRCDVSMHFMQTGKAEIKLDEFPAAIAEKATAAELERKGAGFAVILEHLGSLNTERP